MRLSSSPAYFPLIAGVLFEIVCAVEADRARNERARVEHKRTQSCLSNRALMALGGDDRWTNDQFSLANAPDAQREANRRRDRELLALLDAQPLTDAKSATSDKSSTRSDSESESDSAKRRRRKEKKEAKAERKRQRKDAKAKRKAERKQEKIGVRGRQDGCE